MGIINIRKATREGAKTVIGLAGASGSGKTHTAILLADGIANGKSEKIGFLDTENKRGSLYADLLKDEKGNTRHFLIGDLIPPFTPDRYAKAIKEFEDYGVEVLVIDSVTHEWEGTGGCIEIAEGFKKPAIGWNRAKTAHKKFMNTLLQCDMHIICCIRAREQMNFSDPKNPVSLGVQPIQEKNFMFEMTASLLMMDEGFNQRPLKCPAELKEVFGRGGGYITAKDGLALRQWVDGGSKLDRDVERYKNRLLGITEKGGVYTHKCWKNTPPEIQEALGKEFKIQLYESAESYDTLLKASQTEPQEKSLKDKISVPPEQTQLWKKPFDELHANFPEEFKEAGKELGEPTQVNFQDFKRKVNQLIDQENAT